LFERGDNDEEEPCRARAIDFVMLEEGPEVVRESGKGNTDFDE
jgi:hypothetical protein